MHQQALYLEQGTATLLDELAAETRIPKASLLREAVDDLLTKHGKMNNAWYADIVAALRAAKAVANRYRSMTEEMVWRAKCEEVRKRADELLSALGKK
jgi:ribosomal protein L17